MMDDNEKTSEQLVQELNRLRLRIAEQEKLEDVHWRVWEKAPVMMISLDRNARIIMATDLFLEKLGYERNEILGRTPFEFQTQESSKYARETIFQDFLETGSVKDAPLHFVKKNGNIIDLLLNVTAERDTKGHVVRSCSVFTDVTELRRSELSIRQSETRYRSIFDNMLDGFALCKMIYEDGKSKDFIYVDVNGSFETLTGLKDVTGKKISDVIPGIMESNPELLEIYGRVALTGIPARFETYVPPLGIWFSLSVYSVEKGYFVAVFDNITERKRAEENLRKSEEKFRRFVETANEGVWSMDRDFKTTFVNNRMADMLGYRPDEMIGVPVNFFMFDEDLADHAVHMRVRETGQNEVYERRFRHKDGCEIWTIVSVTAILDNDGAFQGSFAMFTDITDLKRSLQALSESEQKYRAVVDNIDIGISVLSPDMEIINVNKALKKYFPDVQPGRGQLCYQQYNDPPRLTPCAYCPCVLTLKDGKTHLTVTETPAGSETRNYRLVSSPVKDSTGRVVNVIELTEDITEQQTAEQNRIRLETAIEQAAETVVVTDTDGSILYVNPAFEIVTGFTSSEAIGQNPRILKSGEHSKEFYQELWATISGGRTWRGRFKNKRKDGAIFHEEATISPVQNPDGKIVNYVAVKRDVTKEMLLHDQLSQAQKMEAIGTLAGGIAHDFNNLLQVILGYSEMMTLSNEIPQRYKDDLSAVIQAAQNGADLVKGLLMFSRKVETTLRPVDLNQQVLRTRKMLERTIPKMISIEIALDEAISPINADETQIEQVVMNLAINARDAMPNGGKLTIETGQVWLNEEFSDTHPPLKPGKHVRLGVSDNGSGIDKQSIEHIFEPFFTTKGIEKGTGLGLSVVYGIVRLHEGLVTCQSELRKGTKFDIYFPALEPQTEEEAPSVQATVTTGGSETILVVDDEESILFLASRIFTSSGYKVIRASNGVNALKLYKERQNEIALVLLDLMMPEMSGLKCLEELLEINPTVKVVIASGYIADSSIQIALRMGAKESLAKPYDMKKALQVVRSVIESD
jgi:two-component system cell cycle sensor histidine kinase/response regulator CckA